MSKIQEPQRDMDDELEGPESGPLVSSVQRAFRILQLFDSQHPEWNAAELSRRSGLRRTTAFRLVKSLEATGVLAFDPITSRYFLGPAIYQFAYVWIDQASLARIAAPYLEHLSEATDESVGLTVWNDDGPLCVAHSPSPRPFKFLMYVGQVFTDIANAHSKVLLAFGPEERRERALARPLPALTPFTITDRDRYRDELAQVAAEGIAYDLQGQQRGVCALAVPVRDYSGEVRASLSIVVSDVRYTPDVAHTYAQALRQVAAALSYDLGYREPASGS